VKNIYVLKECRKKSEVLTKGMCDIKNILVAIYLFGLIFDNLLEVHKKIGGIKINNNTYINKQIQ
jgi:hypothetical protein